jgi:hypothetical protein
LQGLAGRQKAFAVCCETRKGQSSVSHGGDGGEGLAQGQDFDFEDDDFGSTGEFFETDNESDTDGNLF